MFVNRFKPSHNWKMVRFKSDLILQSAELNEMQSIQSHEVSTLASALLEDGAILSGGGVSFAKGVVTLEESIVFSNGYSVHVPEKKITIGSNATLVIGFMVSTTILSSNEEMLLLGHASGTPSLNEAGADRLVVQGEWMVEPKGEEQNLFYPTFVFTNGILSSMQRIAPELEGMRKLVGRYDYDSNGSYVVNGLLSSYERETTAGHLLSISEGVAHVGGKEIVFEYAQKLAVERVTETKKTIGEPFTFRNNEIYFFRHSPLKSIDRIIGTVEREETLTHGSYFGATDQVSNTPLLKIVHVQQGSRLFKAGVDFKQEGDSISWSPSGEEPAPGSSYKIRYQYRAVLKATVRGNGFTVRGLVPNSKFYVNYTYFLKRVDRIVLSKEGNFLVLKGVASENMPTPPTQTTGLSLATVKVVAHATPVVNIDFYRAYKNSDIQEMFYRLSNMEYNIAKLSLDYDARSSDPSTDKKEIFVDPFLNDNLRDKGIRQNGCIVEGRLESEVAWQTHRFTQKRDVILPFSSTVKIAQNQRSSSRQINSYISATAPLSAVTITPSLFRWIAETFTQSGWSWSSTVTESTKVFDVPQTKITIEAKSFTDEYVRVYIDGHYLKRVKSFKIGTTNAYAIRTELTTPKGLKSGSKLVRLVGERSHIVVEEIWQTSPQKRVVTFNWHDPLAQTILMEEELFVSELALHIEKEPVSWLKLHIVRTTVGIPNMQESVVSKVFDAKNIRRGWQSFKLDVPVRLLADVEYAVVVESGDAVGKCSVAKIGSYDLETKKWITKASYEGVLLSSANSSSWTAHQKEDLTFRVSAARFERTKTVEIGRVMVKDVTDLGLLCEVDAVVGTSALFRATLTNRAGEQVALTPYASTQIESYTGEVVLSVELKTDRSNLSAVVEKNIVLTTGKVNTSTYVSREFSVSGSSLKLYLDVEEPQGSSVEVYMQVGAKFVPLAKDPYKSRYLGDGLVETCFVKASLNIRSTRIKIVLKNSNTNRPVVKNLRSIIN